MLNNLIIVININVIRFLPTVHQIPISIAEIIDFFFSVIAIIIFYYRLATKQRAVENIKLLNFSLIQYNISQLPVQRAVCLRCDVTYGITYNMSYFKPCSKLLFNFLLTRKYRWQSIGFFSLHIKANVNPLS